MKNELTDALAHYIFMLMDGDTHMIDEMYALLEEYGYCDADGFEIDQDEE